MKNIFSFVVGLRVLSLLGLGFVSAGAEPWNSINDPRNMNPNYEYRFDALPFKGGVDDAHMPWSDNYWESDWGGISLRWVGLPEAQLDPEGTEVLDKYAQFRYLPPTRSEVMGMSKADLAKLSPAEKYDIAMGRYDLPTHRSERLRTSPNRPDWEGICHGWVPAAIHHAEPLPVEITNPDGLVIPFGSSDVKALLSYYYGVPAYDFARGSRQLMKKGDQLFQLDQVDSFDPMRWLALPSFKGAFWGGYEILPEKLSDGKFCDDPNYAAPYGGLEKCQKAHSISGFVESLNTVGQIGVRPQKRELFGVKGVKDPNPGAFHIVMANQLGKMNEAFVANIPKKVKNAEIWNQPVVAFETRVVDFDRNRRGSKVKVVTRMTYVAEIAQQWEPVVGTPKQRFATMEFGYTLELDSAGRITGGEWANRKYHPSFLWKHDKLELRGYFQKLNDIYKPRF